ncbi:hypothetical protein LZQ00_12400 [Sphingobacterium sp. SRCM116780]|uniref:hypothetical protein n=1 Tax=Sphingobacterium sp. SRCM116780 TaxID=2907623 RepID=UPI001F44860B|nr:hypothetical protein [Sphingobacterium sp. SRCM116780]UIR55080.1 hypothetical protein LZQ00_12400 [Sphingobacterium sp. SRCM116780]
MTHSFHIPVLGLAFSIDSPLKVARFGISSVISIVDDELIERIRAYYCKINKREYLPITKKDHDYRANRISSYLNLVSKLVHEQMENIRTQFFEEGSEIERYFQFIPESHPAKKIYYAMISETNNVEKAKKKQSLRSFIEAGDIDVNIMAKVDKVNYAKNGDALEEKFSDALAALRGFTNSNLQSSVILSAGMNPRLYSYLAELPAFWQKKDGSFDKKLTLKVSDYRSAYIQAKFLAKKGIWVSEFRVESGLNCGGHAFATDGLLLGPILAEFKNKKQALQQELFTSYRQYWSQKDICIEHAPPIKYTVQGGVGTADEHTFLLKHYEFDAVGWGSPFLLVPEATTVDEETLAALTSATADDFYSSGASPLGVPFNNFRKSSSEQLRLKRIKEGKPGSPCKKKYLVSNIEYGSTPICTASRAYQHLKIKELEAKKLDPVRYEKEFSEITEKTCLCDGLAAPAYLKYNILKPKEKDAVAICPGPNTVWFKNKFSLDQMINHIYGRTDLIQNEDRPFFFINELRLYVAHIKKYVEMNTATVNDKNIKYLEKFKTQLMEGINYYEQLKNELYDFSSHIIAGIPEQLKNAEKELAQITFQN